ncbi:hypothetical protein TSAR_002884, partial [Trichomalopsis sarcophagae]
NHIEKFFQGHFKVKSRSNSEISFFHEPQAKLVQIELRLNRGTHTPQPKNLHILVNKTQTRTSLPHTLKVIKVSPLASHCSGCLIKVSPLASNCSECLIKVMPLASHCSRCFIKVSPLASPFDLYKKHRSYITPRKAPL